VEAMGGSVSVASKVGAGTTFSIRLADAQLPAPGGAGSAPGGEGGPSGKVGDLEISGRRGG
jgi:hypothetical protein